MNKIKFLADASQDSKAFHFQHDRVAVQESSPQNNFRRVIASLIPTGEFCNHKINYVPNHKSKLPLKFIAALLNSDFVDWYFRLGSTNAAVSHYQLYNLPCPNFDMTTLERSKRIRAEGQRIILHGDINSIENHLVDLIDQAPFDGAIPAIIATIVDRIIESERARGEISRSARSKLAPESQRWQNLIDRILARMAGISEEEHKGLRERLDKML
ncbi:MAG TPA: hypothetical protein VGR45_09330 [Stellaceae bacterium]|nr:hypothetical protein [Stellaceae bacterium]